MSTKIGFLSSVLRARLFFVSVSILLINPFAKADEPENESTLQLPHLVIEEKSLSAGTTEPNRQVITSDEIQKTHRTHLIDVLKDKAGLDIAVSGGAGQNASVFIRGSKAEHALILIDGVEISDPTTTARVSDLAQLRTDQIERIEILKGPQAIRYGSDAAGGVIHIITQKGEGPFKSYYNFEGGSFETQSGYWHGRGSRGPWNYNLGVQSYLTQGFSSADAGAGAERDSTNQKSFLAGLGYEFSDKTALDMNLRRIQGRTELDFGGGPLGDDPNYRSRNLQTLGSLKLRFQPHEDVRSWIALSSNWIERHYKNEPDALHGDDLQEDFKSQNSKYETWHQYFLAPYRTLEWGLQFKEERGSSDQTFNGVRQDMRAHSQSTFGQALIFSQKGDGDHWELALRHDQNSRQNESLWNSSFLWSRNLQGLGSVLQVQGGSGFKNPSLFQLHSQFGHEDLKAEQVMSGDVSLQKQITSQDTAMVLYFENHFRNLIDFETATSRYHNISKAVAKGWELQWQWDSQKSWSSRIGGTWMQTRDEETGLSLLRRAHQSLFINFNFEFSPWRWAADYRWIGPRRDLDPQSLVRVRLKSYDVTHLSAAYSLGPQMELYGRIQNLFNRRYQELAGYQTSPQAAYLGLKGHF